MKLSQDIINILKNFAVINNSIVVSELDHIKTISESGNIIGIYKLDNIEFPVSFAIFDLRGFLSIISLFKLDEIDFDFKDKYVEIIHNTNKIKYYYSDKSMIKKFSELKTAEVYRNVNKFTGKCTLTADEIKKIRRASTIMQLDMLSIDIGGADTLTLICDDESNKDTFNMGVNDTEGSGRVNVNVEYLELIPNDYDLDVWSNKCIKFTNTDIELFYLVTANIAKK